MATLDWPARISALLAGPGPLMVFQPIERLSDRRRLGWEALARFPEDRLPAGAAAAGQTDEAGLGFGPDVWFRAADYEGLGVELEVAAVCAALDRLDDVPDDEYIAVNVGPEALVSGALAEAVAGWDLSRVVVELTEHLVITDYGAVRAAIEDLRRRHSEVAVCTKVPNRPIPDVAADDVGAGAASLNHVLELAGLLTFAKLDLHLTRNIDTDLVRQELTGGLVGMGKAGGFLIVAEGVEDEAQLLTLESLGVHAGQGYFLGRPGPLPRGQP